MLILLEFLDILLSFSKKLLEFFSRLLEFPEKIFFCANIGAKMPFFSLSPTVG